MAEPRIKVKCHNCGTVFWFKRGQSRCPNCNSNYFSAEKAKGQKITKLKGDNMPRKRGRKKGSKKKRRVWVKGHYRKK